LSPSTSPQQRGVSLYRAHRSPYQEENAEERGDSDQDEDEDEDEEEDEGDEEEDDDDSFGSFQSFSSVYEELPL
jgi:ribosomal protein L12E/L44/L45/RPP1/RPP2